MRMEELLYLNLIEAGILKSAGLESFAKIEPPKRSTSYLECVAARNPTMEASALSGLFVHSKSSG